MADKKFTMAILK